MTNFEKIKVSLRWWSKQASFKKNSCSEKNELKCTTQLIPVPFILQELRENTASVGFKKNYPGYLIHFIFSVGIHTVPCLQDRNSFNNVIFFNLFTHRFHLTCLMWFFKEPKVVLIKQLVYIYPTYYIQKP